MLVSPRSELRYLEEVLQKGEVPYTEVPRQEGSVTRQSWNRTDSTVPPSCPGSSRRHQVGHLGSGPATSHGRSARTRRPGVGTSSGSEPVSPVNRGGRIIHSTDQPRPDARDGRAQVRRQVQSGYGGDAEAARLHDGPGCFSPHLPVKLSYDHDIIILKGQQLRRKDNMQIS